MKKIIILSSAITGFGHRSVAIAIKQAIHKVSKSVDVKIINIEDISSRKLASFLGKYNKVTDRIPLLYKLCYNIGNQADFLLEKFKEKCIENIDFEKIINEKPNIIVGCHPFLNVFKKYFDENKINILCINIITDPITVHKFWLIKDVPTIVATETAKKLCIKNNIKDVKRFDYPLRQEFLKTDNKKSKEKIRKKLKIKDKFTVLIFSGAGIGRIDKVVKEILKSGIDIQLLVITGNNKKRYEKINKLRKKYRADNVKVYNYVNNINQFIDASDLVITKAGANSIFECIAKKKPMIIYYAIPGQEEGNVKFIEKYRLGIYAKAKEIPEIIERFIEGKIKFNTLNYDKKASIKIAKMILSLA